MSNIKLLIFSACLISLTSFLSMSAQKTNRKTGAKISRQSLPKVHFAAGKDSLNIPFELHNNHIFLQVRINNSDPLPFILDTGASSVISRRQAKSLGLKFSGKERGVGVGENSVAASIIEGVSLNLPGATVAGEKIAAVDLEDLQKSLGRKADGILGSGFFSQFVVEIDYAAKTINLYAPKSYRYKGRSERIPLIIDADSGLVFTRAALKTKSIRVPIKGLFEIDSGGGHALILNKPFVERNNLLTAAQKANTVSIGGIVGSSRAVAGTIESLQLGRGMVENVPTFFSIAAEGMAASEEFDGNIGNDFLRRFDKVIFDYSRRSMILESAK